MLFLCLEIFSVTHEKPSGCFNGTFSNNACFVSAVAAFFISLFVHSVDVQYTTLKNGFMALDECYLEIWPEERRLAQSDVLLFCGDSVSTPAKDVTSYSKRRKGHCQWHVCFVTSKAVGCVSALKRRAAHCKSCRQLLRYGRVHRFVSRLKWFLLSVFNLWIASYQARV